MKLIDGKTIALEIEQEISKTLKKYPHTSPGLAFVLVGDDPASKSYIRMKKKKCSEVSIRSLDQELPASTTEQQLLETIERCNKHPEIDGILVQLPLPAHINTSTILSAIDPAKDIDGFHPINMGKLLLGEKDGFIPCTPAGIVELLHRSNIPTQSKHIVIVGRSNIVGKPLAALLVQKGLDATVTIAHSKTHDLPSLTLTADILIAAAGKANLITPDMVREGSVVIDVGINRIDNRIVGDVHFQSVAPRCSLITPVPGGVGPMTIAMLLKNTLHSFLDKNSKTQ